MTNPYESPSSIDAGVKEIEISGASWTPHSARIAVIVAGISLLPFAWLSTAALRLGDEPQWWSPLPLAFFFPAYMSPLFGFVVNGGVAYCLFARFSRPLMNGRPRIPLWSLAAISVLQILHWIYLASYYADGIRLHGTHMTAVCVINAVLSIAMISTALWCWKRPNFLLAVGFQWLAWFWLMMYAFPLVFFPDLVGGV